MSYLIFFLALIVLILVHEFGHFIVAKAFRIRVDEFSIFFPPRLFSWRWGETQLSLGAIPLGGYVKIFGENPGEAAEASETPGISGENNLAEPFDTKKEEGRGRPEDFFGRNSGSLKPDSKNFSHRSKWVQAGVIVAGILFNLLFAWLALSVGYMVGVQTSRDHRGVGVVEHPETTIVAVVQGSPADKAGIQANDIVESIQTATAELPSGADADAVKQFIESHQDQSMVLTLKRGGGAVTALAKPAEGLVAGHKALGIELDDVGLLKLSPPLALVQGAVLTEAMTVETVQGLGSLVKGLFHGAANLNDVAGPIGIVSIGSQAVSQGLIETIIVVSLISINLAIFNLLPIPGLDGGRLLFIAIEAIQGRPITEKTATRVTVASFAVLIALVLLVSYHDVTRLWH